MKKRITRKRLAQMWCELNCFKTPKELLYKKSFKHESDAWGAMILIETLLTKKEISDAWRIRGNKE